MTHRDTRPNLFPYTRLFPSHARDELFSKREAFTRETEQSRSDLRDLERKLEKKEAALDLRHKELVKKDKVVRSEEHTSELQSRQYLVCRLLLEKKKK